MERPLKILYAAGPGNVIETYKHWVEGRDDPSQVSITWAYQFYDICHDLDAQVYVISRFQEKKIVQDGAFTIEHRPVSFSQLYGLLYHLVYLWYEIGVILSALRFRANTVVVSDGRAYWFPLSMLSLLGIQVIPSLQCVLWCKHITPKRSEKIILTLSRRFFAQDCTGILSMSKDITEQVKELTRGKHRPIFNYLPVYRRSQFADIQVPDKAQLPFRVLFVGRVEANKGVFDLIEIAKSLQSQGKTEIIFDICGNGSALESLKLAARKADIGQIFACHGHCNKIKMRKMYNQSHVVIVPTRTDFREGFNQVVAEAVLAGRPVVTSSVCPAVHYVRDAIVEVPPNDIKAYAEALLRLRNSDELYEEKRQACLIAQEQFYDLSKSWGATLKSIILNS